MMHHRATSGAALCGALLMYAISTARAAEPCTQQDTLGHWYVMAGVVEITNRKAQSVEEALSVHLVECDITIDHDGVISGGACWDADQRDLPALSGRIEVKDTENCSLEGFFYLGSTLNTLTKATL